MSEPNPPMPPKKPWPNSSPNRPAPRKPAASPPNRPLPKKPGRVAVPLPNGDVARGWVMLRWIGETDGAVRVDEGAEKVRIPRLPPENPPPARALAASPETSTRAVATAASAINQRWRNMFAILPAPIWRQENRQGSAAL